MVQIIENWSLLRGRVVRLAPAAEYPGFTAVELDVEAVSSVEGFPNLLEDRAGTRLTLILPSDEARELSPNVKEKFRVRLAKRNGLFAKIVTG